MVTEDKNNIVSQINCCNSEGVYFGESKWFLKSQSDEKKNDLLKIVIVARMKLQNTCCKEYHNFSCVQKKVFDAVSRLIFRKVKETIHSLKHSNQINKIFYMLPEKWLPNLL